jgi:hypothetical protein
MGTRFWQNIWLAETAARPRRCRAAAGVVALTFLAAAASACGTSAPALSGTASPAAPARGGATRPAQPVTPARPAAPATAQGACSIPVITAIAGEPDSADAELTTSWVTLQASGWTVLVPDGDWHLSASTAGGADIFSPDGQSAANLGDKESQTPWTLTTLSQVALSSVSDVNVICQSSIERSSGLTTQATEFTGGYQGTQIHGVVVLSLLTPTTPGFFAGEVRSIYTPVSQWSAAAEQALWLIVKHAVFVPQAP